MRRAEGRLRLGRFTFYIGAIVLAIVVWRSEVYMQSRPQIYGSYVMSLSELQEKQLGAFLDMNRLLTTLGTTVLGAIGVLLFGGFKGRSCSRALWAAIAGGLCVGLSLYFGYHAYEDILYMLQNNTFDLMSPGVYLDRQAHFYTFLVGTVFLADFFYQNMKTEDGRDRAHDVAVT